MTKAKPYAIPKQIVWDAYKKVKANRGAAGVDGQSLAAFEKDLKNNLYKLWNRMSSGSYFPPPVRLVEIPKGTTGQTRPLGIPTVSDRITQMVVKLMLCGRRLTAIKAKSGRVSPKRPFLQSLNNAQIRFVRFPDRPGVGSSHVCE